jgi:hypothetical protein
MFLSEWIKTEAGSFANEPAVQAKAPGMADPAKDIASELDTIIQNLRKIATETDIALSNSDQVHQQNALVRRGREEYFETQVSSLEENLAIVRKEIQSEDEHLERAIIELVDKSRQLGVARKQNAKPGLVQSVIQWTGSGAGQSAVRNTEPKIPVKKIGRWNAQRSRDGYFRLYRKIGGRVHSIYIGKELDVAKAERKVADRETELLKKGQMQIGATKRAVGTQRDDN